MTPDRFSWPTMCQGAVSLTYDDGLPCHPDLVCPTLEKAGLRGTFYVPVIRDIMTRPEVWRDMAARGHELGNHTIFHPCRSEPGMVRDWLDPAYNLANYTRRRWLEEIDASNLVLRLVDGKTERTFGNTCWDNSIGSGERATSLEPLIASRFTAGRGVLSEGSLNPLDLNFNNLGTVSADHRTADDLIAEIEDTVNAGGWIIYTMHGVGPETHRLHMLEEEHQKLVNYLGSQSRRIWTAPLIDIVKYIRQASISD